MRRGTVIIIAALLLLLAGYLLLPKREAPAAADSASPSSSTVPEPAPATTTPTPVRDPVEEEEQHTHDAEPLSAKEAGQVKNFADRFMKAYARPKPGVSYRRWWDRVASMLTDEAIDDHLGTDPALVPVTKVTGHAVLVRGEADSEAYWLQAVDVPTNAGRYRLLVQLPTPGLSDRLLVSSITEPE